jgi:parallel beta-helix repeat protein
MGTLKSIFLIILAGFLTTFAANYYVATNGDNSNPGTISSPWEDISYATCAGAYKCPCQSNNSSMLQAGDTLFIRGGTYTLAKDNTIDPVGIKLANNGTSTEPIVVTGYPGEEVIIDGEHNGAVFILTKEYWILQNLKITRGGTVSSGAGILIWEAKNSIIQNCEIYDCWGTDVSACIRTHPEAEDIIIRNNILSKGINANSRGMGIQLFQSKRVTIENNEIFNSSKGIYFKHGRNDDSTAWCIIRNNYIYDVEEEGIAICTDYVTIENNLILAGGISLYGVATGCGNVGTFYCTISHNTIINTGINLRSPLDCPERGTRYTIVWDNLVYNTDGDYAYAIWRYGSPDATGHQTQSDYNMFYAEKKMRTFREYRNLEYTFQEWQSATGLDANSVNSAPSFVSDIDSSDFSLQQGSPGTNAASDGTDIGVDFSKVGVMNSGTTAINRKSRNSKTAFSQKMELFFEPEANLLRVGIPAANGNEYALLIYDTFGKEIRPQTSHKAEDNSYLYIHVNKTFAQYGNGIYFFALKQGNKQTVQKFNFIR